jgi:hypothetical protein
VRGSKATIEDFKEFTMSNKNNRGRAQFQFVKSVNAQAGIQAVVLQAAKKMRKGSVVDIAAAAIKLGLKKVTSQDPIVQTHVHLNRLRVLKAVRRVKAA